ncbi:restriction endonuclease subunit S [Methylomonas methanica]|uniref:Type I restriction modification DNA specificity domain-containing protein n=1 Tax=Methylomonas methanica TaxID=421 RepID=A0A177MP83_METMH|nr:restriction endonuclease subunit S [Methylomonas methanica]OAI07598.1 hypothetical protein A1332_08945 [Methylomonas methanica]
MTANNQVAEASVKYLAEAAGQTLPAGYKQTEVGVIPIDWELSTIGSYTTWMSGGTPSRSNDEFWNGSIPWISGSTLKSFEISTSDQFLSEVAVTAGSKMAPLGAILLLVRGSALHNEIRAGMVVEPVAFNQDVKALVPAKGLDARFLTFFILGMESELLKLVSSAGNSAGVLDTELVKNFRLFLPPHHEQTAIANALSDVDALINELEKLIAKKQAIKTATMQQLLTGRTRLAEFSGKLKVENGELKNPNHSQLSTLNSQLKKGYKQSELGEVPEDWNLMTIDDVANFSGGSQPPRSTFISSPKAGYIRLIQIRDYKTSEYETYIPELFARKKCNSTDIMIGRYGPPIFQILRGIEGAYNVALIKASPKEAINQEYLYYVLKSEKLFALMDMLSQRSSGQTGVELPALKAYLLPLPSKLEQTAIATILSDMDADIQTLQQRLSKTRHIKQGMMQELLTGRIRLISGKLTVENG